MNLLLFMNGFSKFIFIVLSFFIFHVAFAQGVVSIKNDVDDCLDGWPTMDVTIFVGEEEYSFDPKCEESFNKNFVTQSKVACTVESGMCSQFEPKNTFKVTCKGYPLAKVNITCAP